MRFDQEIVLDKFEKFLIKEKRPTNLIRRLKSGYCNGFTVVWLFAKWLETQNRSSTSSVDDLTFFYKTIQNLVNWDGESDLPNCIKSHIDRLMSLIIYYEDTFDLLHIVETEVHKSFFDSSKKKLNLEFTIAGSFDLIGLKGLLEAILFTNKLVLILSHDHSTGAFKQTSNHFYYNPNHLEGEVNTKDCSELAEKIFLANNFQNHYPSPIAIKIFSFDETKASYPPVCSLLYQYAKFLKPCEESDLSSYCKSYTPIDIAIDCHCLESLHYFLTIEKMNPNYFLEDKSTPLSRAIQFGFNDLVEELLKYKADPNYTCDDEPTALHLAIKTKNYEAVDLLLTYGADPNVILKNYPPALHYALLKNNFQIAQLLLKSGADAGLGMKPLGNTALHVAVRKGYLNLINPIVHRDISINDKNTELETPLHYAYKYRRFKIAKLLLQLGADPFAKNKNNQIPSEMTKRVDETLKPSLRLSGSKHKFYSGKDENLPPIKKIKQHEVVQSVNCL